MSKADNKIRIIDLLNKLANRELKQLTKFKYKNKIFTYARYDKDNPDSDTVTDENHTKLFTEIEELLTIEDYECDKTDIRLNRDKINELVKRINYIERKINDN